MILNKIKLRLHLLLVLCVALFSACQNKDGKSALEIGNKKRLQLVEEDFGMTQTGPAKLFRLKNANGVEVEVTNYGGIIRSIQVPDRKGVLEDIVLGFDSIQSYEEKHPYFGAFIGRYGNRIANATFELNGMKYLLPANNGPNTLHGGNKGFDKKLWKAKKISTDDYMGVELSGISSHLDQGFPGNLTVLVRYLLNNQNELVLEYEATTDKTTVINLTNHSYFNLKGAGNGDILGHELMINADRITPVDETLIPTGELLPVQLSPFDFRNPTPIGDRINQTEEAQIRFGKGYDHNFVLSEGGSDMKLAATVFEPITGRYLEVITTEPGLQFYSGNFLDSSNIGKGGKPYPYRSGFCLETQHFPDSPNQKNFPFTLLEPDQKYQSKTIYRFSVR
jgi:aldose 1-epimerase